jgi:uncharacterized protein
MKKRGQSMSPERRARQAALEEVRAIYREVDSRAPSRQYTRLTECCQFRLTGRTPMLTRGEAMVAAQAVRASGRKALPVAVEEGGCPLLKADGKCLIYQDRPFGCRTHFCAAAGGPYERGEVLDLIRRLEVLDRKLEGAGPRALTRTVADEM